ncbi:fumarylacetoacetate hydrolase family protein [Alkalihalobacillus sp. AL-G]|uniref:fumarylacetoacetate hydrolase family protein n=1 Tax=Alkalihalobacillus sp. AL-G TaxID=2926399 RepID=UPI00272DBD37|nr:fumarylacetoacetate hydrolase family protein [Alkalihalobacillus sp. AL-G]WLD94846.1 fumarylacetoacetate hydrolase family protein [Alkalihalobacillus sp. AL-G]
MKFVTVMYRNDQIIGVVSNEKPLEILNLTEAAQNFAYSLPPTLLDGIRQGESFTKMVEEIMGKIQSDSGRSKYILQGEDFNLLAPIPKPAKNIFCIGKNYRDHALELGTEADIPEVPMVFSKTPTTVIGPGGTITISDTITKALDYEGELAVVIGKTGKGINQDEAYNYVFGYTILNDITARDLQTRHKQFLIGKSLDSSCPMGPYLVHKNSVDSPNELHIKTTVNGEVRQDANTSQMIFDIPTLIETLSKGMTLEAGDIIATGTPAGVGKGFDPPKYLQDSDVVSIEIEKLGNLTNTVAKNV